MLHTSSAAVFNALIFAAAAVAALVRFGASFFFPGVFSSSYIGLLRVRRDKHRRQNLARVDILFFRA